MGCNTKQAGSVMFKINNKTTEAFSEPSQTSKMELFTKILSGFQILTIFEESSISEVWMGSECVFL